MKGALNIARRTIFVSGAGGFIGSNVILALRQQDYRIVGIARRSLGFECDGCIIADLAETVPELTGATADDVFIHLAAKAHDRATTQAGFERDTIAVARNVAVAIAQSPIKKIVSLSSIGARVAEEGGGEARLYGQMKLEAERILEEVTQSTQGHVITIRPPMVYGPGAPGNFGVLDRLISRGVPLPLGFANAKRSYISLSNLVDLLCHLCALDDAAFAAASGHAYEPSDGEPISSKDLAQMIGKVSGRSATLVPLPLPFLRLMGRLLGRKDQVSGALMPLVVRDTPSLQKQVGWVPPMTLAESLQTLFRPDPAA